MRAKRQGTGDRLPGREFVGLGTGSSSSLGSFRDRLPRERYRGSVGLGGFWGLAPRDRACARRKARGRGCFRAMREGVRCSPSTLAPARSRCRWVAFVDRLLLLVRDRLPGELRKQGTGCGPGVGRVFGGAYAGSLFGQVAWGVFRDRLLGGSLGTGYLGNCGNKGQAAVRGLGEFSVGRTLGRFLDRLPGVSLGTGYLEAR